MIGRRIGPYQIVERIGGGGLGTVFRARDRLRGDQEVALKILDDSRLTEPEIVARFRREAKIVAALNHPAIAGFHDFDEVFLEEEGAPRRLLYLVLEWVPGEDLAARLRRRGRLPLPEIVELGSQAAGALAVAHRAGVVHRDLKPANLRITPQGTLKILDFGLAKILAESRLSREGMDSFQTAVGSVLGTARYMAPEQLLGEPVDERSDLFSLGTILYRCATGREAFEGENLLELLRSIKEQVPSPPAELVPELPGALDRLIRDLLAKAPGDRPASATAVAECLDELC
ncbi:MAG: serine/threonine-protein kinase [Thermoanaerobaculia bacterium]|nr:serine/threonine-protein kinase [Thermoanaerobaculia bacterium]